MAMDNGTLGPGVNHYRSWRYLTNNPTEWGVVLEDDAQPVDDFNQQLDMALAAAPSGVVGLYLGDPTHWGSYANRQQRIRATAAQADNQHACFITTQELLHGVGIAIRTNLIPSMLTYTSTSDRPYDYAIRNWARAEGHTISLTWPSLLDHTDGPTLIQHPDGLQRGERKAFKVGAREAWTNTTVNL